MRLTALKPIRVTVSLILFFLVLYLFLDISGRFTHEITRGILFFQFVPAAVTLVHLATAAALGVPVVLILTLLFGRVYCSFLCPLGTLQDLIIGIKSRLKKRSWHRFQKPQRWVPYVVLAGVVIPLFFGNLFLLNLLDPYSYSGKIFTTLFRPVYYGANNLLVWILKEFNTYPLYPVELRYLSVPALVFSSAIFLFIVAISFFRARWYCNAICPVGTVLSLLSKVSAFRILISDRECTSCGLCARVCKGGCIEMKTKSLDFSRCVACYNCFRACSSGAFRYRFEWHRKPEAEDPSRRTFLKQTTTGITGILAAGSVFGQAQATAEDPKPGPITPPGSLSIWNFTSACTACHLCISSCPTKVLQPSFFEYGLDGLFLPRMNNAVNYCNFDCVVCTTVCPTEALRQLTIDEKHKTQIGVSKFIKNICVVVEKKTACGACSEHCPTKAVEMVPYLGTLKIPQVDEKICVGCGACEHACPTRPIRAIYVEPLAYHRVAMKPLKKVNSEPGVKKVEEDFPF
jgi:ferredoxin